MKKLFNILFEDKVDTREINDDKSKDKPWFDKNNNGKTSSIKGNKVKLVSTHQIQYEEYTSSFNYQTRYGSDLKKDKFPITLYYYHNINAPVSSQGDIVVTQYKDGKYEISKNKNENEYNSFNIAQNQWANFFTGDQG